ANARLLGLPDDYVIRYRERLAAVTKPQITMAAKRYFTTDKMTIVVVGDGTQILRGLKALGTVRILPQDGTPMTEADLAPHPSNVSFDGSKVTAGNGAYRVVFNGNPVGTENRTFTRAQQDGHDVWRIVTSTQVGGMIQQFDTTTIDAATLAPIQVRQNG